jgi:hypothetical protein
MRRRTTVLSALPFIVGLLGVAAAVRLCFAAERPVRHYANYAEAKAADALGPRGWIPAWVPATAYDIHDQHAVDSSSRCIRLSLPSTEAEQLQRVLEPLQPHEVESLDATCRLGARWWFEGLIQQQPANGNALNAELHRAPAEAEHSVFVAIVRVTSSVFIWSP